MNDDDFEKYEKQIAYVHKKMKIVTTSALVLSSIAMVLLIINLIIKYCF